MTQAQGRLPKKVMHVLSAATGGATMSSLGLMEAFKKRGVRSCAVCHDMGDDLRERLRDATDGEVLFLPLYWWNRKIRAATWKRPLIEARQVVKTGAGQVSAARVAQFARQHGVELIHTGTVLTPEGGRVARALGLAHVWHVREMIGPGQPFRLPVEGPKLGTWMQRRASLVVANSNASASCLKPWLPEDLLTVVPNGIDVSRFKQRQTSHGGPLVVAMAGSLASRSKRHDLFIEVASRVRNAEFRIYGGVPEGDAYVETLKQRAGKVNFMGAFDDPAKVMQEIDILVQPSDVESFGRVVVEAMASGIPVVGVKAGGAAEIVLDGETGFLSAPDDPAGLAQNVERLLLDPGLRGRMGQAGRERAERVYSLEACADGIDQVYRAALMRPLSILR